MSSLALVEQQPDNATSAASRSNQALELTTASSNNTAESPPANVVMDKFALIETITPYLYAIGRIPGKGSCILVSRPSSTKAILLTSSFVIAKRHEGFDVEAEFFDTTVLGTGIKNAPMRPVRVALRPEKLFTTSAANTMLGGKGAGSASDSSPNASPVSPHHRQDTIGYSIIACDVESPNSSRPGSIKAAIPLTLPLLISKVPEIREGDMHVVLAHADGKSRGYSWYVVERVFENHCVYDRVDLSCNFISGGAVFSAHGDFIGLQHQGPDGHFCIFVRDIVSHLFSSMALGQLGLPVLESDPEDGNDETECPTAARPGIHDLTGITPARKAKMQAFVDRFGQGENLVPYAQLLKEHEQKMRTVRETLVLRKHKEVWNEFYDPSDYRSIVLLLHAFPNHTQILQLVLSHLTAHEHRSAMPSLARLGGVGMLLEALDAHPYDERLMAEGVTALGRLSLYDENKEAIAKYSGIPTILSLMQEYRFTDVILQWATYTLLNLCHDSAHATDNAASFVANAGVESVAKNMSHFSKSRYLLRWSMMLLGHVVGNNKSHFDAVIENGIMGTLVDTLHNFATDDFVLVGAMFLLAKLTRYEIFDASVNYFKKAGGMTLLAKCVQNNCASGSNADPQVSEYAAISAQAMVSVDPKMSSLAIEAGLESIFAEACMTFMTEARLHVAVSQLLLHMGISDPVGRYPHLQVTQQLMGNELDF